MAGPDCWLAGTTYATAHLAAATAAAGLAWDHLAVTVWSIRVRRCSALASARAPRLTVAGLTSGRHLRLSRWLHKAELEVQLTSAMSSARCAGGSRKAKSHHDTMTNSMLPIYMLERLDTYQRSAVRRAAGNTVCAPSLPASIPTKVARVRSTKSCKRLSITVPSLRLEDGVLFSVL